MCISISIGNQRQPKKRKFLLNRQYIRFIPFSNSCSDSFFRLRSWLASLAENFSLTKKPAFASCFHCRQCRFKMNASLAVLFLHNFVVDTIFQYLQCKELILRESTRLGGLSREGALRMVKVELHQNYGSVYDFAVSRSVFILMLN